MRYSVIFVTSLLIALAEGCSTVGTGGTYHEANFSLQSSGTVSGSVNAAVPDDRPASGQFF